MHGSTGSPRQTPHRCCSGCVACWCCSRSSLCVTGNDGSSNYSAGPVELIDIGLNLAHDSFDADRDAVLARARAAGVVQMVITGSSEESTAKARELARLHPGM